MNKSWEMMVACFIHKCRMNGQVVQAERHSRCIRTAILLVKTQKVAYKENKKKKKTSGSYHTVAR